MGFKFYDPALIANAALVTPLSIGTVIGWWKADSFSLSDATAIGGAGNEWEDQSASGKDLTQGTAGARPLFKTNIFGTKPAIRFDGTDDFLDIPSSLTSPSSHTVVMVGIENADSIILGATGNATQFRVLQSGANTISVNLSANIISSAFTNAANTVRMHSWINNDPTDTTSFRENKTAKGSGNSGVSTLDINVVGKASFGGFCNGDIGEIIIWSGVISSANLDSLYENYAKPRWGLP